MVMFPSDLGWKIRVDVGAEGKWREPLYLRLLQAISRKGLDYKDKLVVRVEEETKRWIVLPDMVIEDGHLIVVPMGTDQHGRTVWKPVRFKDEESKQRGLIYMAELVDLVRKLGIKSQRDLFPRLTEIHQEVLNKLGWSEEEYAALRPTFGKSLSA
jgi:hypothetical protein